MSDACLYAAARTPSGRFGGALAGVRPDDLAATAPTGLLDKTPDPDRAAIGEVVWGNANGAGEGTTATSGGWRRCWPDCR